MYQRAAAQNCSSWTVTLTRQAPTSCVKLSRLCFSSSAPVSLSVESGVHRKPSDYRLSKRVKCCIHYSCTWQVKKRSRQDTKNVPSMLNTSAKIDGMSSRSSWKQSRSLTEWQWQEFHCGHGQNAAARTEAGQDVLLPWCLPEHRQPGPASGSPGPPANTARTGPSGCLPGETNTALQSTQKQRQFQLDNFLQFMTSHTAINTTISQIFQEFRSFKVLLWQHFIS